MAQLKMKEICPEYVDSLLTGENSNSSSSVAPGLCSEDTGNVGDRACGTSGGFTPVGTGQIVQRSLAVPEESAVVPEIKPVDPKQIKAKIQDATSESLSGTTPRNEFEEHVEMEIQDDPTNDSQSDGSSSSNTSSAVNQSGPVLGSGAGTVFFNQETRAWVFVSQKERECYLENMGTKIKMKVPVFDHRSDENKLSEPEQNPKKRKLGDVETAVASLPQDVLNRIFRHMTFPDILTVRSLNNSWRTNFTSSPEDTLFQIGVTAHSNTWGSFCPVILNMENESMLGFDRKKNRWMTMILGFRTRAIGEWFTFQLYRGAGSLLCGVRDRANIFIVNLITREWKWLPQRPTILDIKDMRLIPIGRDAYQVVVLSKVGSCIWCQQYHSKTGFWTVTHSRLDMALVNSSSTYLDGNLYFMEYDAEDHNNVIKLVIYNMAGCLWSMISHPFKNILHKIECYELLRCGSQVMIILRLHPVWWLAEVSGKTFKGTLLIFRLDPMSLEISEVCRGPPHNVETPCTLFTCDNNSFYFGDPQSKGSVILEYSLVSQEWTCLPSPRGLDGSFKNKWCTFTFQPGMNPFVRL